MPDYPVFETDHASCNARMALNGADGCTYLDTVGEPTVRKQKGDVLFTV